MKKPTEHDPSRRKFLKNLIVWWIWAVVVWSVWTLLWNLSDDDEKEGGENNKETKVNSLKDKPIHLWYKRIVKDKDVDFIDSTWSKFSMLSRVSRCLRRKPVTDAVEDRYNIPRGILMAMMAQEWMWDPTMPNLPWYDKKRKIHHTYWDGGLWLIHIQAVNAHDFWLTTLPRYTNQMIDDKHAKCINDTLNTCNKNLSKLIEYDDRFHPVMAVDCAARFLLNCKKNAGSGTDDWIRAFSRYSWRWYASYWYHVIKYRSIINDITWEGFPNNFSKNIYTDIKNCQKDNQSIKKKLNTIKFSIDWEMVWYEEYLAYFEESVQNFELEKYVALGKYTPNSTHKEDEKKKEQNKDKWEEINNTMIQSEFVDTKQHNSEWFILYRYKVKAWDSPLDISNAFDERDKQHWNLYKNTWNLNIVKRNWRPTGHIKEWDIVYIKVKK